MYQLSIVVFGGFPYSYYWVTVRLPGSSLGFGVHSSDPFNPPLSPSQNRVGLKVDRPTPVLTEDGWIGQAQFIPIRSI